MRDLMQWRAGALAALGAAACWLGCGGFSYSYSFGTSTHTVSWHSADDDVLPGVDSATMSAVEIKKGSPDGLVVVVWSDLPRAASGESSSNEERDADFAGEHSDDAGHSVAFSVTSPDGQAGEAKVAGSRYDLAHGSLFLVSGSGRRPMIVQQKLDVRKFMEMNANALKKLAQETPEIHQFFEASKKLRAAATE